MVKAAVGITALQYKIFGGFSKFDLMNKRTLRRARRARLIQLIYGVTMQDLK